MDGGLFVLAWSFLDDTELLQLSLVTMLKITDTCKKSPQLSGN